MLNRTMCLTMVLLSSTLFFTIPTLNAKPFLANNIKEEANVEMVQKNELGLIISPFEIQYKKDKLESDKIKAEELNKRELEEIKIQEQQNIEDNREWQEFELSFYTSLNSENGFGAITSQGKKLSRGGIANNIIPQNTKLYLEGYGEVTVNDKGSARHFNTDSRLDVFIEREYDENDYQYSKRVMELGKQHVHGFIVK